MDLDQDFWNSRWQTGQTGWDVGSASPPICEYFKKIENTEAGVLIPGCGNAYEAEYLSQQGFKNITILDIAPKAVEKLQEKFRSKADINIRHQDFFHHNGSYDFIIEQTFFCALLPELRPAYVEKVAELSKPGGKLVGVMFNVDFQKAGPPFGGSISEYQDLFQDDFEISILEPCYNSISPRMGTEIFVELIRK